MPSRTATTLPHDFFPATSGSFDTSRLRIQYVIIHTMVGTLEGTKNWFSNPNRDSLSSAHYGIGLDGVIHRYVDENKTAYHAGNYSINQQSIGIEHEDNKKPYEERTDTLYNTSAKLIADACQFYDIPIDRKHVLKHNEVSKRPTECPATLDIDRLVRLAQQVASPTEQEPVRDGLKTYQMPEATFINMVTEGRNFKDVLEYVNGILSPELHIKSTDPAGGKKLIKHLEELITVSKRYNKENEELRAQIEQLNNQTTPPASSDGDQNDSIFSSQEPESNPQNASNDPMGVLFGPQTNVGPYVKQKSVWEENIFDLFLRVFRPIFGK